MNGRVAERPQHLLMRVAVGIHGDDIERAIESYELMSQKFFTHASATLFNSGTTRPQVCSCYLTCMRDDSVEGVFEALTTCARISRHTSGVAVSISNHRAKGYDYNCRCGYLS